MKRLLLTLLVGLAAGFCHAGNLLNESFEYANHDLEKPVGWICDDDSWLCGYFEKDHNRMAHTGNWYAFSASDDAWMFMPMYLIPSMRYRFTCWAVTDDSFRLEFWAGARANPDDMHTLLLSETVASGAYERFSSYVETIPEDCHYIAIHAVGQPGSYLTLDDIEVDMVEQYTFEAEPLSGDTAMCPGSQAIFHFVIHNTGYDPVDVTVHPSDEFFTDFSFYSEGISATTFATQPDETVKVTVYATLRPEVEPGTVAWLDIHMTIPCNCNTAMVTFWVTPLDPTQTAENSPAVGVYPNPASDYVIVEAEGLLRVTVFDMMGREVKTIPTTSNTLHLDLGSLSTGVYPISIRTKSGAIHKTIVKN